MAPLGQEAEVARALEHYLENRLNSDLPVTGKATFCLQGSLHRFHQRLAVLEDNNTTTYPLDDEQLLDDLSNLAAVEDAAGIEDTRPAEAQAESEGGCPRAGCPRVGGSFRAGRDARSGERIRQPGMPDPWRSTTAAFCRSSSKRPARCSSAATHC